MANFSPIFQTISGCLGTEILHFKSNKCVEDACKLSHHTDTKFNFSFNNKYGPSGGPNMTPATIRLAGSNTRIWLMCALPDLHALL